MTYVIDTSVVVAWLFREPGYEFIGERLREAEVVGIGTPTLLEANIVVTHKRKRDSRPDVVRFLTEFGIEAVDFAAAHQREAARAWLEFGKGRHPARLNYGDCMAYATARVAGAPLLCVGDDFPKTDLEVVQPA